MLGFDVEAYGNSLMQRVSEAVPVKRVKVAIQEWTPEANKCHDNVAVFCEHKPDHAPVRGWLYLDLPEFEFVQFLAHSVVRAPDGVLVDITPWEATQHYPFLDGKLSGDEYAHLVDEQAVGHLYRRKPVA